MNNYISDKLVNIILTAQIHHKRLEDSFSIIVKWGKLDLVVYNSLTIEQLAVTDQYIYRFAKLQDLMGDKLFKVTLEYLEESTERMDFIDVLNRLEKLQLIDSVQIWLDLRIERNKIAHDYAKDKGELIEEFVILMQKKDLLIKQLYNFINYLKNKGLQFNSSNNI